jgi:predicted RNase H-like nuclease (RuvC/YqgF family)
MAVLLSTCIAGRRVKMQRQSDDAHRIRRRAELIEKGIEQLRRDLDDAPSKDKGLERLQRDLGDVEPEESGEADFSDNPPIDYENFASEVERLRKRLAIWEIFLRYVKDGARTWPEVQRAVTPEDLDEITRICDGTPLRDLLLNLG